MKRVLPLTIAVFLLAGFCALSSGCGKKEVPKEIKRKGLYLKLIVVDDTKSKSKAPGAKFGIQAEGIDFWMPDLSKGENATLIGPIPLDKQMQLEIYPEGLFTEKHVATYVANKDMKKESDKDAITVQILDDKYVAKGTPVEGGTQEFAR